MPRFTFTDTDHETESDTIIAVTVVLAIVVALFIGTIVTVAVCFIVKKYQEKTRNSITVASNDMSPQSYHVYSTVSPNNAPTDFRERKVI